MKIQIIILGLLFTNSISFAQTKNPEKLSDAPNDDSSNNNIIFPSTYDLALQQWETIIEINEWIKNNFKYDMERAKKLAENSAERGKVNIYTPNEFYQTKKGVCIDLSRFTVETINKIDTSKNAQYLMIQFEPINIDGKIIRTHWMSIYEDVKAIIF